MANKTYDGQLHVHAIDECIQIRLDGDPIAVYTMSIRETKKLIKYLKAGIREAKKFK